MVVRALAPHVAGPLVPVEVVQRLLVVGDLPAAVAAGSGAEQLPRTPLPAVGAPRTNTGGQSAAQSP
ncbi:hypothetical protein [Streptomyces noursei]|uniref:hypothetical protein n=1 Tax=Streptomyces noursei TaxID=1971 RepID=UPI00057100B0|nr:hypothetical protein [Streptomyces noursei]